MSFIYSILLLLLLLSHILSARATVLRYFVLGLTQYSSLIVAHISFQVLISPTRQADHNSVFFRK